MRQTLHILALICACAATVLAADTTVADTVLVTGNTPAKGYLMISPSAPFLAADGRYISTPPTKIPLAADGSFTVTLVPSTTAQSANAAYTVEYHVTNASITQAQYTETWAVPASVTPLKIQNVRTATVPPAQYGLFPPSQLAPQGANPGDVVTWNGSIGYWAPVATGSIPGTNGQLVTSKGDGTFGTPVSQTAFDAAGAAATVNASIATVGKTGAYTDLLGKPTLGTASAHATTDFDAAGAATAVKSVDISRGVMANMYVAAFGDSTIANNAVLETHLANRSHSGQELAGMLFYNPTNVSTDSVGWATLTFAVNPFTTVGQRLTCSSLGSGNAMSDTYTVSSSTPTTVTFGTFNHITSVALNAAGSGYVVNDQITLAGGASAHQAILVVTAVGGGGSLVSWNVLDPGNYTVTSQTTFTQGSTTGAGSGATFQTALYGAPFGGPILIYSATPSSSATCSGQVIKYGNNGVTVAAAVAGLGNFTLPQTITDLQTAQAAGKFPAIYLRMGVNDVRTDATSLPALVGLYQTFVSQVTAGVPNIPIVFLGQNSILGLNVSTTQSVTPIATTATSGSITAGTNTVTLALIPPSIWPGSPAPLSITGPTGIPFQVILDPAGLSSITAAGGSGYVANELVALNGCGGSTGATPPVIKVLTVSSGAISTYSIVTAGQCGVEPSSFSQLSTSGVGTGATFTSATYTNAIAETVDLASMTLSGSTLSLTFTNANSHSAGFSVQATEATAAQNFSRELREANSIMGTLGYPNVRVVQTQDLEYGTVALPTVSQQFLLGDQLHPSSGIPYEVTNILAPTLSSIATSYQRMAGVTGARTINPLQTIPIQNNGTAGSETSVASTTADPAFCSLCAANARLQAGMGSGQLSIYPSAPMDDNYWTTVASGDYVLGAPGVPGFVRLSTTWNGLSQVVFGANMAVCFSGNGGCIIPPAGILGMATQNDAIQQISIGGNGLYTLNQITVSGGSGYVVNDLIILSGGTGTNAQVRVTAVSGGAITGYKLTSIGWYSVKSTSITQGSTSGSGTGATFSYPVWAAVPYGVSGQRVFLRQPKMVDLASRAFLNAPAQYPNHRTGYVTGLNGSINIVFNDNPSLITWMSSISSGQGADYIVIQGIGKVQMPACTSVQVNTGNGTWTCNVSGQDYSNWGTTNPIDIFSTRPADINASNAILASLVVNNGAATPLTTIAAKTSNYTATVNDFYIGCDATTGAKTITLPSGPIGTGRMYFVTKTDSSANACTVSAAINGGASSVSLPGMNANYFFYWTGAAWAYTQAGSAVLGAVGTIGDCIQVGSDRITLVDSGSACSTSSSSTFAPAVLSGGPAAGFLQGNNGPSGATDLALWTGQAWNRLNGCGDETTVCAFEDFLAGGLSTNIIGTNGWQFRQIVGSTSVVTSLNGSVPHLGIIKLSSQAVAGDGLDVSWIVSSTLPLGAMVASTQPWSLAWVFELGTNTNTSFRIGITGGTTAAVEPSVWAGLRFDTQTGCADGNFYFDVNNVGSVCGATGTTYSSSTGSGVPSISTWYKLVMSNIIGGTAAGNQFFMALYSESTGASVPTLISSASFCASGCTVTTSGTLFNGAAESPSAIVASATGGSGAAASVSLDYFNLKVATPAR